jgi:hypothetical protein
MPWLSLISSGAGMQIPSAKMLLFNAAGVVIGVSVLLALIRPLLVAPSSIACSQRYGETMTFALARAGVLLTAADLQSSLGGKDSGVIDNLSITSDASGPVPVSMSVKLSKGAASPLSAADPKGGMSFPWEPRSIRNKSAACVTYDVWLPADFDFSRGGRLPGLIGADAAGAESFAARIVWRPGGTGAATLRTVSGGEARQPIAGLEGFALPRGRWFRIEQEVVLNTPKQANGKLRVWVDGVLAGERSDLLFRSGASVALTGVSADVFYGGDDAAATVPKDATVRLSPFALRWP